MVRNDVAVCYAYCRRADDKIDDVPVPMGRKALKELSAELDVIYNGGASDPILGAFQVLVQKTKMPRSYPQALLDGFRMDLEDTTTSRWVTCWRMPIGLQGQSA